MGAGVLKPIHVNDMIAPSNQHLTFIGLETVDFHEHPAFLDHFISFPLKFHRFFRVFPYVFVGPPTSFEASLGVLPTALDVRRAVWPTAGSPWSGYHLVMTNSLPWKITIDLIGKSAR